MNTAARILSLASVLVSAVSGTAADNQSGNYGSDSDISDMALIYAGNANRPQWTEEQLQPYVTHIFADGHEDWFFDSFLFLEFYYESDGVTVGFGNGLGGTEWARQDDYEWLLGELFADDVKLHALDRLIADKKKTLGEPPMSHKVVISCCAPKKASSGNWSRSVWGTVDGEELKFMYQSDRLAATKWYIDRIVEEWEAAGFENIDLQGIYWIEEGLYSNGDIIADVNDYARSKGLKTYWIPYYGEGNDVYWKKWKDEYKFDMTYVQPNYAFIKDGSLKPYSVLEECCDDARLYGMGLELEFETQGTSNAMHEVSPELHQRINDYMDVFDAKGVFADAGVAYYTGTKGLYDMAASDDPANQATIDRMADFVVARHAARAGQSGIDDETKAEAVWAYAGKGRIYVVDEAADACCYDLSGTLVHRGSGAMECRPGVYIVSDMHGRHVKLLVK